MSRNTFNKTYHQYPVFSQDDWATGGGLGFEGAQKRFTGFPQPREVFDYALMGLPKIFPLTGEAITPDHIKPYLDSAASEIEMTLGLDISPVERDESFDYISGLFDTNASGLKLQAWPACQVIEVQLRFPHTQTQSPYQVFTIPSHWVALRRNRINVSASYGSTQVEASMPNSTNAAGIFSYITGFARGSYQPAAISVRYVSGFEPDRLPVVVADLIKTWAAWRFISDALAPMFPTNSVSVSIDGISQSAQTNMSELISRRLIAMDAKRQQQISAVTKVFGRTIKASFIGT
jgi:hypothetical protein